MSEIPFIASMRPDPARDEFGRYLLPDPSTGVTRAWTRATTIAHTLDDTYHLTQHQRRMVLRGAAARPDLLAAVPELSEDLVAVADDWRKAKKIKKELDRLCDEAAEAAGGSNASRLGTLLHTITEYDDAGRIAEIGDLIPDTMMADLDAYRRTMDAAGLERPVEYIERIVVNSQVDGAGTLDRMVRRADFGLRIADLKTGSSIDLAAMGFGIQFAEYANADAMFDEDSGQLVPMPEGLDKTIGIVIHLPVGKATCTLHDLNLVEGWDDALTAHDVRMRRARAKTLLRPHFIPSAPATGAGMTCPECMTPDEDPRSWCDCIGDEKPCMPPCRQRAHMPADCTYAKDRVLRLINSAGHPDALAALWRDLNPRGEWTPVHTAAARAKKVRLLSNA